MPEDVVVLTKREKIQKHLKENSKVYLAASGGMAVGAAVATMVVFRHFGGFPLEISQTAKNTALIVWKPEISQIALVKRACPDPIPVLDKSTGEAYASINRAAEMTKTAYAAIRNDAHGLQERWERLSNDVFA